MDSTKNIRVLILEDDANLADRTAAYLEKHEIQVDVALRTDEFYGAFSRNVYDLLLLDIMIPGGDGLEICREVRKISAVPIIFVTALGEETDVIVGLEVGGDDYIIKPFSVREMLARIKSLLRRAQPLEVTPKKTRCIFGDWTLDTRTRLLFDQRERAISLSQAEYRLLELFLQHPFEVLERDFLLSRLGLGKEDGLEHRLDVHISRLRQRLGDTDRKYIRTIHSTGYMFVANITEEPCS